MIREYLGSHGIDCLVQGEHHNALVAGAFIELRLMVPGAQADDARALVRRLQGERADGAAAAGETAADRGGEDEAVADEDAGDETGPWREREALARRVRGARLLSLLVPGIGLGHFAVGARRRGFLLLMTWPVAFSLSAAMGTRALGIVALSAVFDFLCVGMAADDVARAAAPTLPRAEIRRRSPGE